MSIRSVFCLPFVLAFAVGCAQEEGAPVDGAPLDGGEEQQPAAAEAAQAAEPEAAEPAAALEPVGEPQGRVVILGFDGVEPSIVTAMMDAGELPNLTKLRDEGTYAPLASSNPPQSPTAWSSFTTSKHPGDHGVYDFLRRNPENYFPDVGFGKPIPPQLAPDGSVTQEPYFEAVRQGDSFWKIANEQDMRVKILSVPFAYPAEDLAESCMLSALGVPDIRGTTSWFFYLGEGFEKESISGGERVPLEFTDGTAKVVIEGIRNPATREMVGVPVTVTADRDAKSVTVILPEQEVTLAEGTWSEWLEWDFAVTPKYTVRAISRVHALEVGETVRLYMTCLQFHPDEPYIRFTTPSDYAKDLQDRYGFFKTIGWIYDTHALRQDAMSEEMFLEDVRQTMAWRETLTMDELKRDEFDLLVSAWTGPDRVSHMFWRFRDPEHPLYTEEGAAQYGQAVEDTYRKMDQIVGDVMAELEPNDLLMIMSDHGFHSFRRGFNVNTWLIRNGYLTVAGQPNAETALNMQPYLFGYDWANTKAYSLGLGSIFLNLRGREGQGTVAPDEAAALIEEIRGKLLEVTDPETGAKVFDAIYTRDDYEGRAVADAPDLQLGYAEGYQSTKDAAKGSAPAELFEDNDDKWSGEHAASDMAHTPGVFFSNKPITGEQPHLVDLGVTALDYLGRAVPSDLDGKPLL